jgi:hypothetical protein
MRILRPAELHLMRQGLPATPANFKGGSTSTSNPTTTYNYADKRNAVQNGIGVSGDNNLTSYSSFAVTTDGGAVKAAMDAATAGNMFANQTAQAASYFNAVTSTGAANAATQAAQTAITGNTQLATTAINSTAQASQHLSDVGLSMLQANTALANSLTNGTNNLATGLFSTVGGLYRDAAAQESNAVGIAADLAKTQVAAQNDNRYLIAAGLAVVCIVGVMAFSHKG